MFFRTHISLLSSLLRRRREEGGKSRVVTWRNSKKSSSRKEERVWGNIFSSWKKSWLGGGVGEVLNSRLEVHPRACRCDHRLFLPPGGHVAVGSCVVLLHEGARHPSCTDLWGKSRRPLRSRSRDWQEPKC